MNYVTAGEACSHFHISYMTLKRWRLSGKLKCKEYGLKKILYDIDSINKDNNEDNRISVIYARVSTTKQKSQLDHQIDIIKQFMLSNGIKPLEIYSEIASGLNDSRKELNRLCKDIKDGKIKTVYISYKDRLTRFGFEYFRNWFNMFNTDIIILDELETNNKDIQQELTEDLISIIHHYSTKLYSSRKKQLKEIENLLKNNSDK